VVTRVNCGIVVRSSQSAWLAKHWQDVLDPMKQQAQPLEQPAEAVLEAVQ
jgi:hypothetical protein